MKRILALLLALLFCFMTAACKGKENTVISLTSSTIASTTKATTNSATTSPESEKEEPKPLLAGFSEKDITPTEMGYMPGSAYSITAECVEMPLLANAAAFEANGNSLILVSMDILFFLDSHAENMRSRISEATGVPLANIMIAATHTHTGVGLDYQFYQTEPDTEAFKRATDLAVEAAIEAWNSRERAKMGYGKGELCGYSFCREAFMKNGDINTWPEQSGIDRLISEVDQSVNVIRVDDIEGNPACFIVNYANHSDSSSKKGYNPDYPGYMRMYLKEKLGKDITVLYFNGAQGDVNTCDYIKADSEGRYNETIGAALAARVIGINKTIVADDEYPRISVISEFYDAVQRHPSKEDIELGERMANGEALSGLDKALGTEYMITDYSGLGDTFKIEVQTIVLGDFALVALPCEPYSEIALKIKADSPFENTAIIGLANGCHGYIAPDFVQGTSSYVARFSMYNAKAGLGTADLLINNSIALLRSMHTVNGE